MCVLCGMFFPTCLPDDAVICCCIANYLKTWGALNRNHFIILYLMIFEDQELKQNSASKDDSSVGIDGPLGNIQLVDGLV